MRKLQVYFMYTIVINNKDAAWAKVWRQVKFHSVKRLGRVQSQHLCIPSILEEHIADRGDLAKASRTAAASKITVPPTAYWYGFRLLLETVQVNVPPSRYEKFTLFDCMVSLKSCCPREHAQYTTNFKIFRSWLMLHALQKNAR